MVRKYQMHAKRRTESNETMEDVHEMLAGLCLWSSAAGSEECSGNEPTMPPCERTLPTPPPRGPILAEQPNPDDLRRNDDAVATTSGRSPEAKTTIGLNPTVAAAFCQTLATTFRAKVKACMRHVGEDFNANDGLQLTARAYYEYNCQYQMEKFRPWLRVEPTEDWSSAAVADTVEDTTGVTTREQTKLEADNVVRYFQTPRDTDDAKSTRKPISFRKSRIVIRPP